MTRSAALLPIALLGPVQWFSKMLLHDTVLLDVAEHYPKQTWRNRMRIGGPNGVHDLSIPVQLPQPKTPVAEVRIDRHIRWQQQHWRSLQAAYGQSPFFEFYADYFEPFYTRPHPDLLIEFTQPLLALSLKLLKREQVIHLQHTYLDNPDGLFDYRHLLTPKNDAATDPTFRAKSYPQVFSDRFGFRPNLSIIDLLCCCGPSASTVLAQSVVLSENDAHVNAIHP